MKINFYLLQSQLNALKTPTQAIIAKENGIENNIRDALISSEEKHLPKNGNRLKMKTLWTDSLCQ